MVVVDEPENTMVMVRTRVLGSEATKTHLESSSHAENSIVGFLWRQSLQSQLNDFVLFGDEVIGSNDIQNISIAC